MLRLFGDNPLTAPQPLNIPFFALLSLHGGWRGVEF